MAKMCVVGAGPAGLYTAQALLRCGVARIVDVAERLPTPFGLVRTGVAPDHTSTKRAESTLGSWAAKAAAEGTLRFFGNVRVGQEGGDVSLRALRKAYDGVVLACGAEGDNMLQVPGERLRRVLPARAAAWWYNGHPDAFTAAGGHESVHDVIADALRGGGGGGCDTATVVGAGNVALDLARMLISSPHALAATDTAPRALEALRDSVVRRVVMLVRRGPAAAAFTPKELREVLGMEGVAVCIDPTQTDDALLTDADRKNLKASRPKRRVYDLLCKKASEGPRAGANDRQLELRFFTAPTAFVEEGERGAYGDGGLARVACEARGPGGESGEIDRVALALKSIGQHGLPVEGAPFDEAAGVIPNDGLGRVRGEAGLYVAGWLKRGASGIIGTNLVCAANTAACVQEDMASGLLQVKDTKEDPSKVLQTAGAASGDAVSWAGWESIDAEEMRIGAAEGRPRAKMTCTAALLAAAAE